MGLHLRRAFFLLFVVAASPTRADDILFIGNSFTFGASVPAIQGHGGVPQLFEAIAHAQGHHVTASAVTVGGKDWTYHLAQPVTAQALASRVWSWVVLQDFSTRPTRIGDIKKFLQDGETFSGRIAENSPRAGILLYETWARPPGNFYESAPGDAFSGPAQMMSDLQESYAHLRRDLAARDKNRPVRVAPVGTAFAQVEAKYPAIPLDAADHHHSTADGYYLAALVMDETLFHESVRGALTTFFHGAVTIPAADAAKLQRIADEIAGAKR